MVLGVNQCVRASSETPVARENSLWFPSARFPMQHIRFSLKYAPEGAPWIVAPRARSSPTAFVKCNSAASPYAANSGCTGAPNQPRQR